MSTHSSWNDTEIHAYVDGELDAAASERLEADSRSNPVLAARIAEQRKLRTALRAEFDRVLDEPIPQRFRDALAGPEPGAAVTPIGAARREAGRAARAAWSAREWTAMAAMLAVGVFVGILASRGASDVPFRMQQDRLVAADYLDAALSAQLAGPPPQDAAARIGLSFRATGGEYCRTFALRIGTGGLACRREQRWSVELLEAAEFGTDGFRQASSALSPAMVSAIESLGAGEPLTADEERQQLESGWDAPLR